ncbi:hypothetical protein RJ55_03602 [Drechmeria coniospora]|nr:hypothetical protein RJ55_03602 [Drechmeria coniospora]
MEPLQQLRRRSSDLLHHVQQSLPSMSQLQMPVFRRQSQSQVQSPTQAHVHSRQPSMKGTWERVDIPPLPRSSHSLNVISGSAYIFGGEMAPGELCSNDMHVVRLPFSSAGADYYAIEAKGAPLEPRRPLQEPEESRGERQDEGRAAGLDDVPLEDSVPDKGKGLAGPVSPGRDDVPAPRTGHATAVIGSRIFVFGGRGGPDMKPLEEAGRVWVYDTRSNTWAFLDPVPAVKGGAIVPHPAARSGHCATSTEHPRELIRPVPRKPQNWRQWALGDSSRTGIPQAPIVGKVAEDAVDQESDGYGTFLIHAGCLANGDGTNDLWAFDVRARTWVELPAAPGPTRGGTAICISKSRLFRFGGYDGNNEVGGQLDFLHLELDTFDDRTTKGEISIRARPGGWQTIDSSKDEDKDKDRIVDAGKDKDTDTDKVEVKDKVKDEVKDEVEDEVRNPYMDTDTDKNPDTDTDTDTDRNTDMDTDTDKERDTDKETDTDRDRETDEADADASAAEIPIVTRQTWPSPRSVASLEALTIGGGREYLVLSMGESAPSGAADAGIGGTFLNDVWAFQVPPIGMTPASLTDAMLQAIGRKTGEGSWIKVTMKPFDDDKGDSEPAPRGRLASAPMTDVEEGGIVIWGGIGDGNQRMADGWILRLGS